jgi:GrpB-like predicted nucleotidyltransferase (UPF0157 family)
MSYWPPSVTERLQSTPEQMAAAVVGAFPASRAEVEVVPWDAGWSVRFEELRALVFDTLGATALRVDHVGSTSVPGLAAKPIIDIDVIVADAEDEATYLPALQAAGLTLVIREPWWHGHRMFVNDDDLNLHVWPDGAGEPIRHLLFRDWLRTHPKDRERYAQSKRELSDRHRDEPDRYNLAKNAVIDDIYARIFASGSR